MWGYKMDVPDISTAVDSFVMTLYWIVLILIIVAVLGVLVYRLSYKIKVRIRYLTGTNDKVKDCVGKVFKDKKDGLIKLQVMPKMFKTFNMPEPPAEAISLTMKGKDAVEIEMPPNGTPRYIVKDKATSKFKPFDSNDRVFHLNEHEKIESRNKKSGWDILRDAIPYLFILMIFFGLVGFWGEIVAPFNEAGKTNLAITQEQTKITSMLKEIIKKEQLVSGEVEVLEQPPTDILINKTSGNVTSRPPD